MNLNKLRDKAYKTACEHGFHDREFSNEHYLMLVITELSEAVEADRKGKIAKVAMFKEWQGNGIPFSEETRIKRFKEDFEAYIKDTTGDELADACIRLLDFSGQKNINLGDWNDGWDDVVAHLNPDSKDAYSFTELMFSLCRKITDQYDDIEDIVCSMFGLIKTICYVHEINIEWHIEQKMKYNSLRENMHGKKY